MPDKNATNLILEVCHQVPHISVNKWLEEDPSNSGQLTNDTTLANLISKAINEVDNRIAHMAHPLSASISKEDIRKVLVEYFENKINASRSTHEEFNYSSTNALSQAVLMSENAKKYATREIEKEMTTIAKQDAVMFLNDYQKKVQSIHRQLLAMKKKNNNSKTQALIDKKQDELNQLRSAIDEIKSNKPVIDILFPPVSFIREMSSKQISIIRNMHKNSKTKATVAINRFVRVSNIRHKRLKLLINNMTLKPNELDDIRKIISNLNNDALGQEISEVFLEALTRKVVLAVNLSSISFPLNAHESESVERLIQFKSFIKQIGSNLTISSKTKSLLHSIDTNRLTKLLDDTYKQNLSQEKKEPSERSKISKHLSQVEHDFLYLYEKVITHSYPSTLTERQVLSSMLAKCMGNMNFNKRLDAFMKEKKGYADKYRYTISEIKYFCYKSKMSFDANQALLEKCGNAIERINLGETVEQESQITLYELGCLEDIAKLKKKLDKYDEIGLVQGNTILEKLHAQTIKSAQIFEKMEESLSGENIYHSGDLLMNHSKKSLALKNKTADTEVSLTHTFISQYGHATQIYIDPETNKPTLSHIYGGHQTDEVKLSDLVVSDIFKVEPLKLITKSQQVKLAKHYKKQGLDFKKEVEDLFQKNIQLLHQGNKLRFAGIQNDKSARFQAGLADFGLYGGHYRVDEVTSDICDEMYGERNTLVIRNKMICSEFVARSLIAALHKTNQELQSTLNEDSSIINMPLEKENLSRIHPERLVGQLIDAGCLKLREKPDFIHKLINDKRLDKRSDVKIVKASQAFYEEMVKLGQVHKGDISKFKQEGHESFNRYIERENLNLDEVADQIPKFLDEKFTQMYQEINTTPNIIIQFFESLKKLFGFQTNAQKIITRSLEELSEMQKASIETKYQDTSSNQGASNALQLAKSGLFKVQTQENKDSSKDHTTRPDSQLSS